MGLKYIGRGAFLAYGHVPARDLTSEEAERYGGAAYLVSTGLYEAVASEDSYEEITEAAEEHAEGGEDAWIESAQ